MLNTSRFCRNIKIPSNIKPQVSYSSQNITRNGLIKRNTPFFKNTLCSTLKVTFLRSFGTAAIRYSSNASRKNKKTFVSWLLTRKGLMLVGVFLGLVTGYYVVLLSICIVLDEVIKKTIK